MKFKRGYTEYSQAQRKLNMLDILFGSDFALAVRCSYCGNGDFKQFHRFECDLVSASMLQGNKNAPMFETLLMHTLSQQIRTKQWCSYCGKYKFLDKSNQTLNLPNIFNINFPIKGEDLKWLRTQPYHLRNQPSIAPRFTSIPEHFFASFDSEMGHWKITRILPGDEVPPNTKTRAVYELTVCIF